MNGPRSGGGSGVLAFFLMIVVAATFMLVALHEKDQLDALRKSCPAVSK